MDYYGKLDQMGYEGGRGGPLELQGKLVGGRSAWLQRILACVSNFGGYGSLGGKGSDSAQHGLIVTLKCLISVMPAMRILNVSCVVLPQVLTIGATNLAQELDQALLRPGRFEVVYEIPSPGPQARLEILKYHSRNKPVADPNMFVKVAEATSGWSAAALANLMNEAAILTVSGGKVKVVVGLMVRERIGLRWLVGLMVSI